MDIIKERRIINLNSEDATTYNNGSFLSDIEFNFRGLLKDESNMIYCEGGVLNAQIPVSFYQVAYYNNTLYYEVTGMGIQSLTVPVGNYNFATFSTALENAFTAAGYIMNITISETTGRLTFIISGFPDFTFYGASSGTTIFKILGFDPTQDYPSGSTTLEAPYLLNLLGPKKLKISSTVFSNNGSDTTNYATSNIISTFSVDAASYGLIVYNNLSDAYGRLKIKRIDNIDIQIRDEYGNLINFNNTDWSITLALIIYRKAEYRNTDLGNLIDSINTLSNNLVPILTDQQQTQDIIQPAYEVPTEDNLPLENQIITDQQQLDNQINPENQYDPQENLGDITDLDLLIYENPNLF
jgi:hypothetical protein